MLKRILRRVMGEPKVAAAPKPRSLAAHQHGIDIEWVDNNAIRCVQTLQDAGFEAYIVGGAVRDLLLGNTPKDFDIATNATPEQVLRQFRRARSIGKRFRIIHVYFGRDYLEVTTFRGEHDDAPTDEHGRVLRDNVYGTLATDAARRDLTVNAMYYDPVADIVLDFHGGLADLKSRTIRLIGEPETRYREDPVRILRVIRFAAKLGFRIEKDAHRALQTCAELINNCSPSRLFDETQKLLLGGHALATLALLQAEGLDDLLLPMLRGAQASAEGKALIEAALIATDARVQADKPVMPSFMMACLLWPAVEAETQQQLKQQLPDMVAFNNAMNIVLDAQDETLTVTRKNAGDIRDIWFLQTRLNRPTRRSLSLFASQKARAAYDFYLLRAKAYGLDDTITQLWHALFAEPNPDARLEIMASYLAQAPQGTAAGVAKRRRKPRSKPKADGNSAADGA